MALTQLTDEQIRTWSRSQKDQWWFKNVYRGDMAQLTVRSALTGFCLGGVLAATNLYIGGKTGITTGVGLTSVILAFALYRALARAGFAQDFTILENNCTQSIATAAGYMTSPLISALAAYMIVTGHIIPWWHMLAWMLVVAVLGVFLAFPMKRRFINEDQLPFPEGRAAGVVLDALYHGAAEQGMYKARLLAWSAALAAFVNFISGDGWMRLLQFTILHLNKFLGWTEAKVWPEDLDTFYYNLAARFHLLVPSILGTDIRKLGLNLTLDLSMIGIGGLMGIRVATSCLLGAFINFVILAPLMIRHGDIVPRVTAAGTVIPISRAEIVNQWSLWWAVAMMVTGSLVSLLGKPELFRGLFKRKSKAAKSSEPDVLKHIELPLWMSAIAVPILTVLGATVSHEYFGVPWFLAFISFPLIFVLTIICTNSMALTSWTPTGSLAKITQFTMAAFDRSNPASNLIPGGMTSEISANAANLLSDIKPGYMLGAKPRQQAIGHVIGIFAGALAAVPLFYLLFLKPAADGTRSTATIVSEQFAMPAAVQWRGVAELIAHGLKSLAPSAIASMVVAVVCAAAIEIAKIATKGRFPLSAVSIGLGVVLPPKYVFPMWLGALIFWWMGRRHPTAGTKKHDFWVEGCEPICAGLISGWALTGIANSVINVVLYA